MLHAHCAILCLLSSLLPGITPERLASFDRAIRSPPQKFPEQVLPQLTEDLIAYRCGW